MTDKWESKIEEFEQRIEQLKEANYKVLVIGMEHELKSNFYQIRANDAESASYIDRQEKGKLELENEALRAKIKNLEEYISESSINYLKSEIERLNRD